MNPRYILMAMGKTEYQFTVNTLDSSNFCTKPSIYNPGSCNARQNQSDLYHFQTTDNTSNWSGLWQTSKLMKTTEALSRVLIWTTSLLPERAGKGPKVAHEFPPLILTLRKKTKFESWIFNESIKSRFNSISGSHFNMKTIFPCIGLLIIKIRRSWDHLIFIMGIPILVRQHLYTEIAPFKQSMHKNV